MEKLECKEKNDEINLIKTDYKLHTFTSGFHSKIYSFPKKETNKFELKNKYTPLKGEKLNKKNLNRFDSKSDYISDLWNKIISKNLKTIDKTYRCEDILSDNLKNLEQHNIHFYNLSKKHKKKIQNNSNTNTMNNMIYKTNLNNLLNNSLKQLDLDNILNNKNEYVSSSCNGRDTSKDNKEMREDTSNNFNIDTNYNFYKFNSKIFTKFININKKYKKLYEDAMNENIELKKENENLKNIIKEKDDEIDIMKEENELNKENIKEN